MLMQLQQVQQQLQGLNLGEQHQDPSQILFLQESVSSSFSQGAPNPKKPGENLPGEKIKAVSAKLEKKPTDALKFPALKVFTVDDPDTQDTLTFSLDTRRLLAFKLGKVHEVRTKPAPIREIRGSHWKMTAQDGGYNPPQITDLGAKKDIDPPTYTTLFKLKQAILNTARAEDALCTQQHVVGEARELRLDQAVQNELVQTFHLR